MFRQDLRWWGAHFIIDPLLAQSYGWNAPFIVAACLCLAGSLTWIQVQRHAKPMASLHYAKTETPTALCSGLCPG